MIKGKYDLALKCRERREAQIEEILGTLYYFGRLGFYAVLIGVWMLMILGAF